MPVRGIFAPRVLGPDGADREKRRRLRMAVGAPPQLPWPERALRGAAVAFAFVGPDAAAAERNLDGLAAGGQPALAPQTCCGANLDRGEPPACPVFIVSL